MRRRWVGLSAGLTLCACGAFAVNGLADPGGAPVARGFVENRGQWPAVVQFSGAGAGATVYFTEAGLVLDFVAAQAGGPALAGVHPTVHDRQRAALEPLQRFALRMSFADGKPAGVSGRGESKARYNYLLGRDAAQWTRGAGAAGEVIYHEVWPGIDIVFHEAGGALAYNIVARPGAQAARVKFVYEGASWTESGASGDRIGFPFGVIADRRAADGASGQLVFEPAIPGAGPAAEKDDEFSADGAGDLAWSTFLGGARDEAIYAVALDIAQQPVVVGATRSTNFPTSIGVLDPSYNASFDAFVTKFDAAAGSILWSTYLGAAGDDRAWAVRLDSAGRPVIAGITGSANFPVSPTAYDTTFNGQSDAFVAQLSADGSVLLFGSFFGGALLEWDVSGLALDGAGRPVIAGSTKSADLPTTAGAYDATLGGNQDAFVAQFAPDGSTLVFSTYLGGSLVDTPEDLVLDAQNRPVVVGRTYSSDFPTSAGAVQPAKAGSTSTEDAFVAGLGADGGSLAFGTYLGGGATDGAYAAGLDADGWIHLAGHTNSSDFPTTPGAYSRTHSGEGDAFVARLAPDASALSWATYYGGTSEERAYDLAVDAYARPVITGYTFSADFPVAGLPYDDSFNGPADVFVARLRADGAAPVFSSYVGGWFDETGLTIALDAAGRPIVGGATLSSDFPSTPGAADPSHNSPDDWEDGFLLLLRTPTFCTHVTTATPFLEIEQAVHGVCPVRPPEGHLTDLIEGRVDLLGPANIGAVTPIACDSPDATFGNDTTPAPGAALFQLARYSPGGSYTDGAATGLVGSRIPLSGDCP